MKRRVRIISKTLITKKNKMEKRDKRRYCGGRRGWGNYRGLVVAGIGLTLLALTGCASVPQDSNYSGDRDAAEQYRRDQSYLLKIDGDGIHTIFSRRD